MNWPWSKKREGRMQYAPTKSDPGRQRALHSWEQMGSMTALTTIAQSAGVDFPLYDALRQGIPVIDSAIGEMVRLVGVPEFVGDPEAVDFLNAWFDAVPVIGYNVLGLRNFMQTQLDGMLMYGKAGAEIVLTNARDGVYGLKPIPVNTLVLKPAENGLVSIGQQQTAHGIEPVIMDPDFLFYSVNRPRGDKPHGTSLLASLPFVAEIWLRMVWSMGQTWMRFGTPRYHVNMEIPKDAGLEEEQIQRLREGMRDAFTTAMEHSRDATFIDDFFSNGGVTVEVIGAAGEALAIEVPARVIMEQIISVTGLPAWWFGFSFGAQSERLGSEQAKKTTDFVGGFREELTPDIRHLAEMVLLFAGISAQWGLKWSEVNLTDRTQSAQADQLESQALAVRQRVAIESWRQGIITQLEAGQEIYPELREVAVERDEPVASPSPTGSFGQLSPSPDPFPKFREGENGKVLRGFGEGRFRNPKTEKVMQEMLGGMVYAFEGVEKKTWRATGLPEPGGNGRE